MPTPTPAKWTCDSSDRPAAASRSNTSAEPKTITKALQIPPMKRRKRKSGIETVAAIAAVVTPLTASAPNAQ